MNLTKTIDLNEQGRMVRFLLLLTFVSLAGFSAQVMAGEALTLDSCLSVARRRSPELKTAQFAVDAARQNREMTTKSHLPQIKLVGDAGYAPASLNFGYDPAVSNGGEMGARILGEQALYTGGRYSLELRQASTQVEQSAVSRQQRQRDLTFAVRQAFIQLLMSKQQHDLRILSVDRLSDYSDLVTAMHQSGAVGYADLLNAQVETSRAKINADLTSQAVTSARLELSRLLGFPADTSYAISGSLDSLLTPAADTNAAIPEIDADNNLEVNSARLDYRQSQLGLSLTRSQWKPTVSVTADAGVVTSRENLLLPRGERYNSTGYSVGLAVEMPLWDWGKRKADVAKGRNEVRVAQGNLEIVRRDLLSDYRNVRSRLLTARRRLISIRQIAQTAEKSYLLNKAQYADGSATASDVLLAEQALTDTQQSEIETLAEIQSLKARLDQITRPKQDELP